MNDKSGVGTVETRDGFVVGTDPAVDSIGKRLSKHGKRIGRPPGSKSSGNGGASVSRDPLQDKREDCAIFVETCMVVFVSTDEFLKRLILSRVAVYLRDTPERLKEFELEVANRYVVTEADKNFLRGNLVALALKYPILRKIGPEISLAVFLIKYSAQQWHLMRAVEQLAPRRKPAPTPDPAAN